MNANHLEELITGVVARLALAQHRLLPFLDLAHAGLVDEFRRSEFRQLHIESLSVTGDLQYALAQVKDLADFCWQVVEQ